MKRIYKPTKKRCCLKIPLFLLLISIIFGVLTACSAPEPTTIDQEETPPVDREYSEMHSEYLSELYAFSEYMSEMALDPVFPQQSYDNNDDSLADEPIEVIRYAASCESNKYHRLSCHYVDRIKSYNLIYYYTEDEALDDGKKPCSVCSP